MRRAAKVDTTQAEIVAALRKAGCRVYIIREPVDLLVGSPHTARWHPIEVKSPGKRKRLQPAQEEMLSNPPAPVFVVWTVAQALEAVGIHQAAESKQRRSPLVPR